MVDHAGKPRGFGISRYVIISIILMHVALMPFIYMAIMNAYKSNTAEQFISQARAVAGLISDMLSTRQLESNRKDIIAILDSAILGNDVVYIQVSVSNQDIILPSDAPALSARNYTEDSTIGENGDNTYYLTVPVYFSDTKTIATLNIGFDETPISDSYQKIAARFLLITLLYLVALVTLVITGVHLIHKPLVVLSNRSRDIADGNIDTPLHLDTRIIEIDQLAADLETMRTSLVTLADDLQHKATHDDLTALANRNLFNERLDRAVTESIRTHEPFAVLLLDLNRFKEINDILGHDIGDEVLNVVAARMKASVRESDVLARIGGDEFCLLIYGAGQILAEKIAANVLDTLKPSMSIKGHTLKIGASIGISIYPDNGKTAEDLMRRADVAMYHAKRNNLTLASYHDEMDSDSHANLIIAHDIKQAMKTGQLRAVFEPRIDIANNKLAGFELLLRWEHPTLGILSPEQFIPLAERDNQICKITRWVVSRYLPELASICGQFPGLVFSLNVSPNDLLCNTLLDLVLETSSGFSFPLNQLTIEVTENTIMSNPSRSAGILNRFHESGVNVSVDDFGTGYSSLSYLQKFPISELKIDKSFIHKLSRDSGNYPIVNASITMAHDLGIKVVAEGVEDAETCELLRDMGCDSAQGYYFGHSVELAALESFIPRFNPGKNVVVKMPLD
ncbi:MAG: EAL domain-containing protein [Gammaproteobacteria bacterium]|nr:EAL domain-containing protein [Gammaproteobacteria bacterium]